MLRPEYTQEIRWAIPLLLLQKHTEDYAHRSTIQLEKDAKINTDTVYQRCRASRFVLWFWSRSLTIQLFLIFFVHFILEVVVKMVSPKNAIIPTPQLDWTVYFFFSRSVCGELWVQVKLILSNVYYTSMQGYEYWYICSLIW